MCREFYVRKPHISFFLLPDPIRTNYIEIHFSRVENDSAYTYILFFDLYIRKKRRRRKKKLSRSVTFPIRRYRKVVGMLRFYFLSIIPRTTLRLRASHSRIGGNAPSNCSGFLKRGRFPEFAGNMPNKRNRLRNKSRRKFLV